MVFRGCYLISVMDIDSWGGLGAAVRNFGFHRTGLQEGYRSGHIESSCLSVRAGSVHGYAELSLQKRLPRYVQSVQACRIRKTSH